MSPLESGIIGIFLFLFLLCLRIPVAYCMAIVGFLGCAHLTSLLGAYRFATTSIFNTFSSYSLTVAPMFIFMGFIAYYSGIGGSLFNLSYKLVGHFRGGLALSTQMACALFGSVCGSLPATVATMGSIAYPEMKKYNYANSLSTASIAAGSSLGSMIPPSVLFIIYGIAAEQSIGKLFLAGIAPGILHMFMYMLAIILLTSLNPSLAPVGPKASWKERLYALRGGIFEVIVVFTLSLGGLFMGWFTPTEAGAFGAFTILIITIIEKRMDWTKLRKALHDTMKVTAMIYLMVAGAIIFGRFLALSRIPFELAEWAGNIPLPPFAIMAVVILIYFVLGFFIDALALILLTIPIFYPLVVGVLGYDPIWFGVIILLIVSMAVVTPPVGMNVYIIKGIAQDVPLETVFRGMWPFIITDLVLIGLLIAIPQIAIFLPNLLF